MKKLFGVLLIPVTLAAMAVPASAGYSPSKWYCDGGYPKNSFERRMCSTWGGHWNPST